MLQSIVRYFYPDIREEETRKFSLLSVAFFLTIGAYWMLRLLKDTIFFSIAFTGDTGRSLQPTAKTFSVFIVFFAVLIYSKLVDKYKKEKLFGIICGFYTVLFLGMTGVLIAYEMLGREAIGETAMNAFGWVSYFSIESFGSIVVALFWSYTASICTTAAAKRGYPFIIASAQIGAILGSLLNIFGPTLMGDNVWPLFLLATLCIASIAIIIKKLVKTVPKELLIGNPEAAVKVKKKAGVFESIFKGITLILSRPYIFGIFIISTFYEVVGTIIDYQMKSQAHALYGKSHTQLLRFFGIFGTATNGLAFIMALLGTSYLLKKYGLRFCLLVYPLTLGSAMAALYAYYLYGAPGAQALLWSTFAVMVVAKGLSYAVNNPTKEMMYIPTSKDAKFKAKGFIDMFGSRSAKLAGSRVNNLFKHDLALLMGYGTMMGFGLIAVWLLAAVFVGIKNAQLVRDGEIVE